MKVNPIWNDSSNPPEDDRNILVSWKNSENNYNGPYRAYYIPDEGRYFSTDHLDAIPLNIDLWTEIPEFPK